MWRRWLRESVATLLAVVAVLLTFFPPPSPPLRWFPAAAAVVLAVMLIWSRLERRIPPEHAQSLRDLASAQIAQLDLRMRSRFSGDPDEDKLWRGAFRSHFQHAYASVEEWDNLVLRSEATQLALEQRVLREAGVLATSQTLNDTHVRAALKKIAEGAHDPAAGTGLNLGVSATKWGWMLILGGSGIGQYATKELAEKASREFQDVAYGIPAWPEVSAASTARSKLEQHRTVLRAQLTEIRNSHTIGGHCRLCR